MVYRSLLRPILFRLPPETAHHLALHSLVFLQPKFMHDFPTRRFSPTAQCEVRRFGLSFQNPVGVASDFDEDGIALRSVVALGFGSIEAGTVTRYPQPGNPQPRVFRLPMDQALINRAGFNNEGAAAFVQRVSANRPNCVLGVSIGKSKITPIENATEDYLASFESVYPVADYVAINVSSQNPLQLRQLQQANELTSLLTALQTRNHELQLQHNKPTLMPLLVKLSPDLDRKELEIVVDVIVRLKIDGVIATNTTVARENLITPQRQHVKYGEGGLSGLPLRHRSTEILAQLYQMTGGTLPLVGVGGIFTADDAWEKVCAGASLVQLYTGFIYQGPEIVRQINDGLAEILKREGFKTLDEAVGCNASALAKGSRERKNIERK